MKRINYEYYDWLVSQIDIPNGKRYSQLFEIMHNTEFHWTVPNDDNRVQDGLDLRYEFAGDHKDKIELQGVTFLEVLVALSRRVAFNAGGEPHKWAWVLMKNLRLQKCSDPLTRGMMDKVHDTLDTVIWRTYEINGRGGFFPLNNPNEDQTKLEIWHQMSAYILEMNFT
jgi:hypothetical protein